MTTKGYQVNIISLPEEDGGGFLAVVPELAGCMIDGDTPEEALRNVEEAINDWISIELEDGKEIPKPKGYRGQSSYSGKIGLRLPKWMHAKVAQVADEEECSINQYIQNAIAYSLGMRDKKDIHFHFEIKQTVSDFAFREHKVSQLNWAQSYIDTALWGKKSKDIVYCYGGNKDGQ